MHDFLLTLLLPRRVLSMLVPSRGHWGRQRQRHLPLGHHLAHKIGPVTDDAIYAKVEHLFDPRRDTTFMIVVRASRGLERDATWVPERGAHEHALERHPS